MFENALAEFKEKRNSALSRVNSLSVDFLKNDLNDILKKAIEKLSEVESIKAEYCSITYSLEENDNILCRDSSVDFMDANGENVAYFENAAEAIVLGKMDIISKTFEDFSKEMLGLSYVEVTDFGIFNFNPAEEKEYRFLQILFALNTEITR